METKVIIYLHGILADGSTTKTKDVNHADLWELVSELSSFKEVEFECPVTGGDYSEFEWSYEDFYKSILSQGFIKHRISKGFMLPLTTEEAIRDYFFQGKIPVTIRAIWTLA